MLAVTLLAPAPASEQLPTPPGYRAMLAEVEALTDAINAGEPVRKQLFDALAKFPRHAPLLAVDPHARAIRVRAQLNLARTYLSEGADESAAGVMDEIIRSTRGEALPVDEFGPSLAALYADRQVALERAGTASVEVRCAMPCRVYVNEREAGQRVDNLYLGIYRIWVEAEDNADQFRNEWVQLTDPHQTVMVEFSASPASPSASPSPTPARVMPRALEIALIVVGSGVLTAGGLALGLDGAGRDRNIAGAMLTGIGGAALAIGGVTLTVDEVRMGTLRGQQAMVVWRVNF